MKNKKKAAVLFSGGKDSCLALHKSLKKYDVCFLLNIYPKNKDSFMFHKPSLDLVGRQAEELGIELIILESQGEKEKELEDLKNLIGLVKDKIDVVIVGGIASSYQGERIKKICSDCDVEIYAPLWNYTQEELWKELLEEKFEIIMTKISCDGLKKEWIGRVISKENFEDLRNLSEKHKFRLDFEGGEAETAVLFMPVFKHKIKLDFDIISENEYRHFMKINKIKK